MTFRVLSLLGAAALLTSAAPAGERSDGRLDERAADVVMRFSNTTSSRVDDPRDTPVRVTVDEVNSSNQKALAVYHALVALWDGEFTAAGAQFAAPRLVRFRQPVRSSCGVISPSNAAYCVMDNTIYFDDVFVAAQAKIAGRALGGDGDMAGLGIIAHEMGHAVAMQLGFRSRRTYDNEAVADCLAGAFARKAGEDGSLEHGDLEEAFFGMAAAADPTFEPTGDERTDRLMAARLSRGAHGTREQRTGNFDRGLSGGGGACLPALAN